MSSAYHKEDEYEPGKDEKDGDHMALDQVAVLDLVTAAVLQQLICVVG
jgi:hypothetical protein